MAVLMSLLLGAGGGFGYAWWRNSTDPVQAAASQSVLSDLEAQLQDAKTRLAAQQADASRREAGLTARVSGLEDEIAMLKSEGSQSARAVADLADARTKVQNLETALTSSQKTVSDLMAQLTAKPGDDVTAGLQKQIEDLTRTNTKLGEDFLTLQEDSKEALTARQKALDDMRINMLEPLQKQRDELANANSALLRQVEKLQADQASLSAELSSVRTELAGLKDGAQTVVAPAQPVQGVTEPVPLQKRSAGEVRIALAATPGLDDLSAAQRLDLAARLEKGECVTTALQAGFKRVPVVALSHLLRALPGGC